MHIDIDQVFRVIQDAIPYAELLAKYTTTIWDDRAVALMKAAAHSEVLANFIKAILGQPAVVETSGNSRTLAIEKAAIAASTPEVQAELEKAGLNWVDVMKDVPQIVTLLLTLLGKRR